MCGKLFNDTGKKVCPDCYQQILDKEHEVVEYVRDHKGAKIPEICEATGAPSGMIKKMIRDGNEKSCKKFYQILPNINHNLPLALAFSLRFGSLPMRRA